MLLVDGGRKFLSFWYRRIHIFGRLGIQYINTDCMRHKCFLITIK